MNFSQSLPVVITPGEPAGIGPDLCITLAQRRLDMELVVCADPRLLQQRAKRLNLPLYLEEWRETNGGEPAAAGHLKIISVTLNADCQAGQLNPANASYVLQCLQLAINACMQKQFAALITGPVHKGIINDAGFAFSGHTEFLAEKTHAKRPVMMLQTQNLRVALVTTHMPLRQVADALNQQMLQEVIEILHHDLRTCMGISQPAILVCGLNPHAGEGGHLGREENDIIEPVLEKLRSQGMNLEGPLPADTIFSHDNIRRSDAILAMFHDQGLPVLKHLGFGNAVNVTLGLPIIRTSVDHGTALPLAGTGRANVGSLDQALQQAVIMANHKLKHA